MALDTERLIIHLDARLADYERSMARARTRTDSTLRNIEKRFDTSSQRIRRFGTSLAATFGLGFGGAFATRALIRYADAWTSISNRLLAVGVASDQVRVLQEQLYDVAIRSRTAFTDVAEAYSRLKLSASELALQDRELLEITETLSKALQIGGASATEAASATLQLTQALGSGFLQGDELRAIRENAPVLAQAIAREFGVSVGQLKQLGAEGALTSERVAKAILNATGDIEEAFSRTSVTVSQAMTNVESAFQRYIGQTDSALGITKRISQGLVALAENMDVVLDTTLALAAIIATALLGRALNPLLAGIVATSRALGAVAAAFLTSGSAGGVLTASLVGAQIQTTLLTGKLAGLRAALAFLGPGGIIAAAATIFFLFADSQTESQKAADALSRSVDSLQVSLAGLDKSQKGSIETGLAVIQTRIAIARVTLAMAAAELEAIKVARQNSLFGPLLGGAEQISQEAVDQMEADLIRLEAILEGFANPTGGGGGGGATIAAGGDADKRAEAIADLEREIALNEELIANFHRGAEALDAIKAAYDAVAAAKKAGFVEGTNEFERFVGDKARVQFQQRQLALLEEGRKLTEDLRTVEEERAATLEKLNELRDAGAISEETYRLAVEQTSEAYERQQALIEELKSAGERAFDRIGSAITQAFTQGEGAAIDFKAVVMGILSEILQEMFRLAALNPLKNLLFGSNLPTLSDAGGLIGSLFGAGGTSGTTIQTATRVASSFGFSGFRAAGGPVASGQGYIVGEQGPEYFRPNIDGQIIPNSAFQTEGPSVVVNVINRAPDSEARVDRSSNGSREQITVLIDEITARNLQRPGSKSNRVLTEFGGRRPLTQR